MNRNYDKLLTYLNQLDTVSKKQSEKLAISMIKDKEVQTNTLNNILTVLDDLSVCESCNLIRGDSCTNCVNDKNTIYVFYTLQDSINFQDKFGSEFKLYSLDISKKQLSDYSYTTDKVLKLKNYVELHNINELNLIMEPSVETELITKVIKTDIPQCKIFRPSTGLNYQGSIEYQDEKTLREAINKREEA